MASIKKSSNLRIVLESYAAESLSKTTGSTKFFDMVGYWKLGSTLWPTIFLLFADYGPIQPTSVPSGGVISLSAETFMADLLAPALGDDEKDLLRSLAIASEMDRKVVRKGLFVICEEVETEYTVMPKDELK
ncbi:hypothetical protein B0H19DRAFT_1275244 [Mycena capillaripes]|nr:hypothetical protein B0H19DRAFT_1275244 [Mycena capillaripes]